jgi:hypothetical protein
MPAEWLLFLDEPSLALHADSEWATLSGVVTKLKAFGIPVGVHCCNEFSIDRMLQIHPDYLSLDVSVMALQIAKQSARLNKYQAQGGQIVWGILPTATPEESEPLGNPIAEPTAPGLDSSFWQSLLLATPKTQKPIWVSAACGLASMTVERALRVPAELNRKASNLST